MADSPSFNDIRAALRTALQQKDPDKGADLCVCDLGTDWVVYEDPDATTKPGLFRCGYRMDGDTAVLTGKPVQVARVTSYEPVGDKPQPTNLRDAASETRRQFAQARNKRDS